LKAAISVFLTAFVTSYRLAFFNLFEMSILPSGVTADGQSVRQLTRGELQRTQPASIQEIKNLSRLNNKNRRLTEIEPFGYSAR